MTFVWLALAIIGYAAVGAFLSGFFDGGDDLGLWCVVWPLIFILGLFMAFMELIANLGEYIADNWFK